MYGITRRCMGCYDFPELSATESARYAAYLKDGALRIALRLSVRPSVP